MNLFLLFLALAVYFPGYLAGNNAYTFVVNDENRPPGDNFLMFRNIVVYYLLE